MSSRQTSEERYRALPPGLHGLDAEAVARHQRTRLRAAIVELVVRGGYHAVRVDDVLRLAHVSRPTFYALYRDKEACFLDAYDEVARRISRAIVTAHRRARDATGAIHAGIATFLALAAADPDAVAFFIYGGLGGGERGREHYNRALLALTSRLRRGTTAAVDDLTIRAVLGGLREVVAIRLRRGEAPELPQLAEPLTAWVLAYPPAAPAIVTASAAGALSPPAGDRPDSPRERFTRLPSGRHDLTPEFIRYSQRERIMDAVADIVAERGYPALTVTEIARRANVSHKTFYEHFPGKREAFLAAGRTGGEWGFQAAVEAYAVHAGDWPRAVAAGLQAYLRFLAVEPGHARLGFVDVFTADPEALQLRDEIVAAFVAYLRPSAEVAGIRPMPAIAADAIGGAIWELLQAHIQREPIELLPSLAPKVVYIALAPFLGPRRAARVAVGGSGTEAGARAARLGGRPG
ncbi:MAG TPA: TetR/AcrR family transcriptional regulator [Solirubrobacteraceae bacterium]|jgi:AcrR family transcriptional regulator|nr:TetR/AcrR family transcriptional regulator [Solirubrobacteraceae bacterium]